MIFLIEVQMAIAPSALDIHWRCRHTWKAASYNTAGVYLVVLSVTWGQFYFFSSLALTGRFCGSCLWPFLMVF